MFPNRYAEAVREFARKHDLRNRCVPPERETEAFWNCYSVPGDRCPARGPGQPHNAPFLGRGDRTAICVYCLRIVFR